MGCVRAVRLHIAHAAPARYRHCGAAPEFVGKKLEAFAAVIEENARQLIDRFRKDGEVDLIDQFTTRLPVNVILDMLALPKADHDFFHDCYTKFMAGLGPDPVRRKAGVEANARFMPTSTPTSRSAWPTPGTT